MRLSDIVDRLQVAAHDAAQEGREYTPSPAEVAERDALAAQVAALRSAEDAERLRVHEMEIRLREQKEFGYKIGAHGASFRDETNPNVISTPPVHISEYATDYGVFCCCCFL